MPPHPTPCSRRSLAGAPVDVFVSADQLVMDRAAEQGAAAGRHAARHHRQHHGADHAARQQARAAKRGRPASPAVSRIAIGQPRGVPAGRYAVSALEAAGLWTALEPKAIYAQNVRQALDYVARGEVDAGFVYASDAQLLADRVRVAFTLATTVPVRYPAAVIASSRHPEVARRFVEHLAPAAGAGGLRAPRIRPRRDGKEMEQAWIALALVAQGGAVGHAHRSGAGCGHRLVAGAAALRRPRRARCAADAAAGAAAHRARLLPAGAAVGRRGSLGRLARRAARHQPHLHLAGRGDRRGRSSPCRSC